MKGSTATRNFKDEIRRLKQEFQLVLEQRQVSVMHAILNMVAEFMIDSGPLESGGAANSTAVGENPRGAGPNPVRETPAAAGGVGKSKFGSAGVALL